MALPFSANYVPCPSSNQISGTSKSATIAWTESSVAQLLVTVKDIQLIF